MKKRLIVGSLLVTLVLVLLLSVGPARAQVAPAPQAKQPESVGPVRDLFDLLNYPYDVAIKDLEDPDKETVVSALMARPEAVQLRMAMAEKGFFADLAKAEAMQVVVHGDGDVRSIDVAVVPMGPGHRIFLPLVLRNYSRATTFLAPVEPGDGATEALSPAELSAYLVAMEADDGTTYFQAHHTNLDPRLAEVADAAIIFNDMPYFYITTLQIVGGRIVHWRYWWFDSHHHPNWYYAYYQHHWDYYYHYVDYAWPWWHHWAYGWYYWRFWYYWSTWFPWAMPIGG